jgi:hypothetical protein
VAFFWTKIMARARNIKPAFFQNEELGELQPIARLAFIAMWTVADYKGCMEYRPKRLMVQLLPYDNCDIELIVTNLEQSGFITTYSVNEQTYIKILNFEKHQNPHPNEKKSGSDIPDFDKSFIDNNDLENIVTNHEQDGTNRADSLLLIPDTLIPIPAKKPSREIALVVTDNFDVFWKAYPKKSAPDAAKKSWNKLKPNITEVLNALQWQKQSEQWQKNGGQFIPNPATYLNQGRWKDEPPVEELW